MQILSALVSRNLICCVQDGLAIASLLMESALQRPDAMRCDPTSHHPAPGIRHPASPSDIRHPRINRSIEALRRKSRRGSAIPVTVTVTVPTGPLEPESLPSTPVSLPAKRTDGPKSRLRSGNFRTPLSTLQTHVAAHLASSWPRRTVRTLPPLSLPMPMPMPLSLSLSLPTPPPGMAQPGRDRGMRKRSG